MGVGDWTVSGATGAVLYVVVDAFLVDLSYPQKYRLRKPNRKLSVSALLTGRYPLKSAR
jgi:hypothetical protein